MPSSFINFLLVAAASAPARYGRRSQSNTKQARKALSILLVKPKLIENESANEQENGKVGSRTRWSKERKGEVLLPGRSRMTRESHVRFL